MKITMRSRVRAYLAQRRALGFRLRSEGYLFCPIRGPLRQPGAVDP